MDFISKMAVSKMGQLRLELVELEELLEEAKTEEQIRKLKKKPFRKNRSITTSWRIGCGPIQDEF